MADEFNTFATLGFILTRASNGLGKGHRIEINVREGQISLSPFAAKVLFQESILWLDSFEKHGNNETFYQPSS